MPRDDWAKYARRDAGRKALRSGNYDRVSKGHKCRRQRRKRKKKTSANGSTRRGAGTLFPNASKRNDQQPDFKGCFINANGTSHRIVGWKNTAPSGVEYIRLAFEALRER